MKEIIYLAAPYSHVDADVREWRFHKINAVVARLINLGYVVFSPITHNHPVAKVHSLPKGWEFWKEYDFAFLERCSRLFVLQLDGWEDSVGVMAEIDKAKELKIPIEYID
jgi:hypothetical protein